MGQLTRWLRTTRSRLRLAQARGCLAGAALLMLALGMSGLLLPMLAASAAPARAAAAVSPLKGRPTRTPRPTSTPTATAAPSPTPTATGGVSPTAVPTATATAAASTAAATGTGGQAGSDDGGAQADAAPLGWLAGWGLGAVIVGMLGLAACIVLLNRVAARNSRQAAFASPTHRTTPARLNQLHHLLPTRQAAPPLTAGEAAEPPLEDDEWQPVPPALETPPATPLKPPRWMIEAGLLKEETGELPAEQPPEP